MLVNSKLSFPVGNVFFFFPEIPYSLEINVAAVKKIQHSKSTG